MSTADTIRQFSSFLVGFASAGAQEEVLDAIRGNADLIGSTVDALIAGADADAIHEYIKAVLVAVSDAEMRREFPGQEAA